MARGDGDPFEPWSVRNSGFWEPLGRSKLGICHAMDGIESDEIRQAKQAVSSSILRNEDKSGRFSPETREKRHLRDTLRRFAEVVRRSRTFVDYLSKVAPERAEKLEACGSWLQFREYAEIGESRCTAGVFCQQKNLCPFCAGRIAGKRARVVAEKVAHVLEASPHLRPFVVTLTMRSMDDAKSMVGLFWDSWGRLVQRRRDARKGRGSSVMGLMDGGFMSGEAKRGKGGKYHYHGHGLFLSDLRDHEVAWRRLNREWAKLVGQEWASIQFRPVYGETFGAVKECTKYAIKFEDSDFDDRWEWFKALHQRMTFRSFGSLYGLKLPESCEDDVSGLEMLEYLERAFCFNGYDYTELPPADREPAFDDWNEGR